jgi:hypothetical protein
MPKLIYDRQSQETKVCSKCGTLKTSKGGYCKKCNKEYQSKYYINNKEKIKNIKKKYYIENKEKLKEKNKLYKKENREAINKKMKEYWKLHFKNNQEKHTLIQKKWRRDNPEKYKKQMINGATRAYFCAKTGLKRSEICGKLFELKKYHILLNQAVKEVMKC